MSTVELYDKIRRSETCQFYRGKPIFITGATGFCGKVILEKIVRVLLPIKRIYVLIRSKRGRTAQQRLEDLLKSKVFSFHEYLPEQFSKLVALDGDCSQPDMGLSEEDKLLLINEVNLVIHSAASVKFDASFSYNFSQNTLETKYMIDL